MRLQLAIGVLLLLAGRAEAQTAFTSKLQVYADDDHTTVVSPLVRAQADLDESTNVSAGYVADVVTSASVDVVSQASPTTIHDLRHQVSLGATRIVDLLTLRGGYTFSTENDYLSSSFSAGASRLFNDKNTTLAWGASLALNDVGRSGDAHFSRSLTSFATSLSLTQILGPRLIVQLTYDFLWASGYQASPYRFVPLMDDGVVQFWVPETDPEERFRHALVVGANRAVGEHTALQADYRLYRDTWAITSHTAEVRLVHDLAPGSELRLRARTYVQSGSSFYRPEYDRLERYMTADRELSAMWSETLGAKLSHRVGDNLELELKLDGFYYHYDEFPALRERLGVNAGVGAALVY